MTPSGFTSPIVPGRVAGFGSQRRNQIYGPRFFDTDFTLMKSFAIPHWEGSKFQIGAQAFNILNHPNFDQPVSDISNPSFGNIIKTIGSPTSIFGYFLGGDDAPRPADQSAATVLTACDSFRRLVSNEPPFFLVRVYPTKEHAIFSSLAMRNDA
jgi:hypothetical protein